MTQHYPPLPAHQRSSYSPYQKIASNIHSWTANFGSCQTQHQGQPAGASSAALQRAANTAVGYPIYPGSGYYASEYQAPSSSPGYVRNGYGDAMGDSSFGAHEPQYGGGARPGTSAQPPLVAAPPPPGLGYQHYQHQNGPYSAVSSAQAGAGFPARERMGSQFYTNNAASQPARELAVRPRDDGPQGQHDYARTNNASLQHILHSRTVTHELAAPLPAASRDQPGPNIHPHRFQENTGPQTRPEPSNMLSYAVTPHRSAVARLRNDSSYPVPALQVQPAQTSHTWPAGQPAAYPTATPHDSYTNTPLRRGSVNTSPASNSSSEWSMLSGEAGGSKSPVYELEAEAEWMLLQPHADAHALRPAPENMHSQVTHHVPPLLFAPELAPVPTRQVAKKTLARKDKLPKVSSSYTQRAKKSKVSKRNGPMGEDDKANARLMRQMGICYRCRFYKSKCDPGLPCNNCLKTKDNARVFKLPCSRERLVDAALVRHCNGRFAQDAVRFITDYQWREGNVFDMVFMWNLPPSGDVPSNSSQLAHRPIRAGCRLYSPTQTELDTTSSPWKDITGNVRDISQAPYAIYDTANFQMQVQQYLLNIMPSLEAEVFSRVRNDDLASLTFTEAVRFRYAQHSELIDTAMKITCLSMVSQGYGNVISENIPGVRKYAESGYPHMGYTLYEAYNRSSHDRPLPTAINHQWDVAVLLLLKQLELKALKILEKKTFKGGPKAELPWYEIYLALFVLVWNMAFIKTSANRYIESKSDTALENQVRATVSRQISDWDRSFSLILMHWRGVLRDFKPFMLGRENPEELRKMGQIDETAFRYVRGTCEILARKGIDRHQPPLIAPSPTASEWIKMIFREAGADT